MVQNLGPKWLEWSLLGGPRVVIFYVPDYELLLNIPKFEMADPIRRMNKQNFT